MKSTTIGFGVLSATLSLAAACVIVDDPAEEITTDGTTAGPQTGTSESDTSDTSAESGESSDGRGDDESSGSTGDPPVFEHCDDTPLRAMSDMTDGQWADVQGAANLTPGVIDHPAGGYVTATLVPGGARGAIDVTANGNVAGAIEGDPADDVTVGFLAAPGVAYDLEGRQAASAPEYPTTWALSWVSTPIADCWEPNQNQNEAAPIAFDAPIRGYINAGYESGDEPLPESYWDYYRIEAEGPGVMDVSMDQVPSDGLLRIRILDAAGQDVGSDVLGVEEMGVTFSGTVSLPEAGTYYVRVYQLLAPALRFSDDGEIPESWTTPYIFTLGFTAD